MISLQNRKLRSIMSFILKFICRRDPVLHPEPGGPGAAAGGGLRVPAVQALQPALQPPAPQASSGDGQHRGGLRVQARVRHQRHEGAGGARADPGEVPRLGRDFRRLGRRREGAG